MPRNHLIPAMRRDPQDTALDGARTAWLQAWWRAQDPAYARYSRSVEENVRLLFGDHWLIWSPIAGRFIDLDAFLTEQERARLQRPTINWTLYWFILTHARLTENQPVLTFRPGPDVKDSTLAEMADTIHKVLWEEMSMAEMNDLAMAWVVAGGQAFLKTRLDPDAGTVEELRGEAVIPAPEGTLDPETGAAVGEFEVEDAPFDLEGNPLLAVEGAEVVETAPPGVVNEGGLEAVVLGSLECRGTWDAQPWHMKAEHVHRTYLTPEAVYESYGVEVEPDTFGVEAEQAGELQRLMFGTGSYGMSDDFAPRESGAATTAIARQGLVQVTEYWRRPSKRLPGHERQRDPATGQLVAPGGRLLACTKNRVLTDGPRPADFRYTSPIRRFTFLSLPGRHAGSTPLEALAPIQRLYNKMYAQIGEHVNLVTNPIMFIDQGAAIDEGKITNEPGQRITGHGQPGVAPIEFVVPPPLSADVYRFREMLRGDLETIGNIPGAEGAPPTSDASGELVKELRFNSDRFLGPTSRRAVVEYSRLAEDWLAYLEVLWSDEKVLAYTGEDEIARHITVTPALFTGKVNIIPDVESMLPEGRGERQARVAWLWQNGAFGDPLSPPAVRQFMELARFPHLGRAYQPGGVHRETARQENAQLAQGVPALAIPIFPWYDDLVHIEVMEEFMASQDYLALPPEVQQEFTLHWQTHHETLVRTVQNQFLRQAAGALTQTPGMPGTAGFAASKPPAPGPNGNGAGGEPQVADLGAFLFPGPEAGIPRAREA